MNNQNFPLTSMSAHNYRLVRNVFHYIQKSSHFTFKCNKKIHSLLKKEMTFQLCIILVIDYPR